MMRVLVLDGNENQAVACVRSLARAGHEVIVGAPTSWSKAGWSRHARGSFRYPAPDANVAAFTAAIVQEAARVRGTLVLPMTERCTLPLSEQRAELERVGARIVLPSHEIVLRAYDKSQTTALAASLGVSVPKTDVLVTSDDAAAFASRAIFPVVLKPASSEELGDAGTRTTGAPAYARNVAELQTAFESVRARASAVLAQEYVEGSGAGYFALMHHGEPRAEFAHRRIRDVRPSGSGSALRASVRPLPAVREASIQILSALKWHGVAMVEFRLRPDGTPVFLEVNGRFWNSLALAVYAGTDFPALLAEMAEHGDVAPPPPYREGVLCRWFLGDVRHLLAVWGGAPEGYTGKWPGRLTTLARFVRPVPGTFHDNFNLDDPLPEIGDWFDFVGRKIPKLLRKRA